MAKRLHRQCPHCKDTKGFRIQYSVGGWGFEDRDFKGEVLDAERNVHDTSDREAVCLSCGKHIDADRLEIF